MWAISRLTEANSPLPARKSEIENPRSGPSWDAQGGEVLEGREDFGVVAVQRYGGQPSGLDQIKSQNVSHLSSGKGKSAAASQKI